MAGAVGTIRVWSGKTVEDRVRLMFGQVWKSIRWPQTRTIAVQMILNAGCPSQNQGGYDRVAIDECQIAAVFDAFKNSGYYLGDVFGIDTYQTLRRTMELAEQPSRVLAANVGKLVGDIQTVYKSDLAALGVAADDFRGDKVRFVYDCDDATIGLCSLLASVGFRVGAKVIGQNVDAFNHVYAVVEYPRYVGGAKRIVTLDATEPESYPGWEPEPYSRRAERIYWYTEGSEG